MVLDIVFRESPDNYNCPKCGKVYTEGSFRNLQKHCNRRHNLKLLKETSTGHLKTQINRINNNRKLNKTIYRQHSASLKSTENTAIHNCRFQNRYGQKCKRKVVGLFACVYHQRKTECYSLQKGVFKTGNQSEVTIQLRKSLLPDKVNNKNEVVFESGNGVFTTKHFQKGDYITQYCGTNVSYDQINYNPFYFLRVPKSFKFAGIDGLSMPLEDFGLGSFINQGFESRNKKYINFLNNVRIQFNPLDQTAWIVAKRYLPPHRELYLNYGDEYNMRC